MGMPTGFTPSLAAAAALQRITPVRAGPIPTAAAPAPGPPSLPPFLKSLTDMLNDTALRPLIWWGGDDGDSVVVHNIAAFSDGVLPRFFKHSNFPSFVRQVRSHRHGAVDVDDQLRSSVRRACVNPMRPCCRCVLRGLRPRV